MSFAQNARKYSPNEVFTVVTSFAKVPIDFFGFSLDRIFTIELDYESCKPQTKLLQATFKITLPVVKQSEIPFKPPGTTYPDHVTRIICAQAFKMNERNSDEAIERCIILEEFKLMSKVDRYKIYGYITMLHQFLDIENSFELDLLKKCDLRHANVKRLGAINYSIAVSFSEEFLEFLNLF